MICAACGRKVSIDFVAISDYCPSCKASPFPECVGSAHAHGAEDGPGLSCPERFVNGLFYGACMLDEKPRA